MLNKTSINLEALKNIFTSIRESYNTNSVSHVVNKRGYAYLAVRKIYKRGTEHYIIVDNSGVNINKMIIAAAKRLLSLKLISPTVVFILKSKLS